TAAQPSETIRIAALPDLADIARRLTRHGRKAEARARRRRQDHREQLEQRALAGAALADQRELAAALDVEPRYHELKTRSARVVDLVYVAQREHGLVVQGSASRSSGCTESPSTGPPSSDTQRSRLSCSAR